MRARKCLPTLALPGFWGVALVSLCAAVLVEAHPHVHLQGQVVGPVIAGCILLMLHELFARSHNTNERQLSVDLVRGVLLHHVMTFHLVWDLDFAGVLEQRWHVLNSNFEDTLLFGSVITVGHLFLIFLAVKWSRCAEIGLCMLSWFVVSSWRNLASRSGMSLLMFLAGYISRLRYQQLGAMRKFLSRVLFRSLLLACVAVLITLITYAAFQGEQFVCFGAPHLLALGGVIQLPFIAFPWVGLGFGLPFFFVLLTGRVEERSICRRELDYQPILLGLTCQILGVGCTKFNLHICLQNHLKHNMRSFVHCWLGQHALRAYLLHQLILMPLSLCIGTAIKNIKAVQDQ